MYQDTEQGEALSGQACKRPGPFLCFFAADFLCRGGRALERNSPEERGGPSGLCQEGKRKLTESAKEFPKGSAWHSPKGPFREALERRALPPRLCECHMTQCLSHCIFD